MKLIDIIKAVKTLNSRAHERVPTALAYKMMKFVKASENDGTFFNAKFADIVERYAERDENGQVTTNENGIVIAKDRLDDCQKCITELEGVEVNDPGIWFNLNELSELKLSMAELFTLDKFITEEAEHGG